MGPTRVVGDSGCSVLTLRQHVGDPDLVEGALEALEAKLRGFLRKPERTAQEKANSPAIVLVGKKK